MARVWDEALLDAIRRDVPAPTVHARNLFHVSAAMWDAWAAYEPDADGYFVDEKHDADDVQAAREAAISYAAYRVLLHRYSIAAGLEETFSELASTMESLCYASTTSAPRATRRRRSATASPRRSSSAARTTARSRRRATSTRTTSRSTHRWWSPSPARTCAIRTAGSRWRWRRSSVRTASPMPGKVQSFIGPHWGHVTAFALSESAEGHAHRPRPATTPGRPGGRGVQADRARR